MLSGVPVIFSRTGPGAEIIQDGVDGLLADPYEYRDVAEKVIYILTHQELAKKMASVAQEIVRQRFSARRCAELSLDFYTKCIKMYHD